jgi:hypothetical protein
VFADAQDRYSPRDEIDPRIKPGGTQGWTSWNVLVDWELSPSIGTAMKLSNASDHLYREFGSGLDAPGLGVSATIEVRF